LGLLALAACSSLGRKQAHGPAKPKLVTLPYPKPQSTPSLRWPLDSFYQSAPRWPLSFYPENLPVFCKRTLSPGTVPRLQDIYGYIAERRHMDNAREALILLGDQQKMYLVCRDQGTLWVDGVYAVSTAKDGFAECSVEHHTTPIGLHVIYDKQGSGLAEGTVLESRLDSGLIGEISTDAAHPVSASVTTRALILSGREPRNNETYEYQIYMHGTTREYSLGEQDSSGCIRLRNRAVMELFDLVPMDTPVFIDGKPRKRI
jgi:hypothetical protein